MSHSTVSRPRGVRPPIQASPPDARPPSGDPAGNWRNWLDVRGEVHGDEEIQTRFGMPLIDPGSPDGENYHEAALFLPNLLQDQQRAVTRQATSMQIRNLALRDWRRDGRPEDEAAYKELQEAVAGGQKILTKILSNEPLSLEEEGHRVAASPGRRRDLNLRNLLLEMAWRVVAAVGGIASAGVLSQYHHDSGSPVCDPIVFTMAMTAVAAALLLYLVNRPLPLH